MSEPGFELDVRSYIQPTEAEIAEVEFEVVCLVLVSYTEDILTDYVGTAETQTGDDKNLNIIHVFMHQIWRTIPCLLMWDNTVCLWVIMGVKPWWQDKKAVNL